MHERFEKDWTDALHFKSIFSLPTANQLNGCQSLHSLAPERMHFSEPCNSIALFLLFICSKNTAEPHITFRCTQFISIRKAHIKAIGPSLGWHELSKKPWSKSLLCAARSEKTTFGIKCHMSNASITMVKSLSRAHRLNVAHVWRLRTVTGRPPFLL